MFENWAFLFVSTFQVHNKFLHVQYMECKVNTVMLKT